MVHDSSLTGLKKGIYQARFPKQTSELANAKHPAYPFCAKPLGPGRWLNLSKETLSAGLCCHVKEVHWRQWKHLLFANSMNCTYILQICFTNIPAAWITFSANISFFNMGSATSERKWREMEGMQWRELKWVHTTATACQPKAKSTSPHPERSIIPPFPHRSSQTQRALLHHLW